MGTDIFQSVVESALARRDDAIVNPSSDAQPLPIPQPRTPIAIRDATLGDIPFIDSLQKMHSKMVGWMPMKQLEGKIAAGEVLVAEEGTEARRHEGTEGAAAEVSPLRASVPSCLRASPLGYVIAQDRYFKRDDVGIVYQLNVAPVSHRKFIGATLLKAVFDRAAYGCRLFCCWCAQDIAANRFWEAMGFVPLAYRAGSEQKGRVHIFWQKRIRENDETTPWWFPSQTTGGSIREDRLVLPIPPGTHWSDAKPVILPGEHKRLEQEHAEGAEKRKKIGSSASSAGSCSNSSANPPGPVTARSGLRFGPGPAPKPVKVEKPVRVKKPKVKNDPKLVAAARELRDRYLEHINDAVSSAALTAKYDIRRMISGNGASTRRALSGSAKRRRFAA